METSFDINPTAQFLLRSKRRLYEREDSTNEMGGFGKHSQNPVRGPYRHEMHDLLVSHEGRLILEE